MSSVSDFFSTAPGGDGAADSTCGSASHKPVASIFVHAGAGYHSVLNERVHLQACTDAARIGMSFLRAGATATQAVEAAIRCLEDNEITNSGFGSNLNIDGVVECDATIVDHLGRSGACGAVGGVKNPITLAKKILDTSRLPLSLGRVPPNILVGSGAKDFAEKHALKTTPNEHLVSRNAKDRYLRWSESLRRADTKRSRPVYPRKYWINWGTTPDYDTVASPSDDAQARDHFTAILRGTWNEGQPDSPDAGRSPIGGHELPVTTTTPVLPNFDPTGAAGEAPGQPKSPNRDPLRLLNSSFQSRRGPPKPVEPVACAGLGTKSPHLVPDVLQSPLVNDGPANHEDTEVDMVDDFNYYETYGFDSSCDKNKTNEPAAQPPAGLEDAADMVTDTVGVIAIDLLGQIAAGSSSGGIGMKHKGRTGPAALVGIGTAVVPEDPDDDLATSVAAVTSGTGEHMAACLASSKCADRLYQGTRRGPGGRDILEEDEHTIMESFVVDDFMNHPGVRSQTTAAAIGVMAVKKDRTGVYFYFSHNTDSFALASMSSTEREPLCVMSRLGKTGRVALGGRKIRLD
ncbi:nucleophile aminohydrolase [Chaetomium fimeti]|uniref:Nucleophile aminohydrolase n=1 Tax=Chaetomium fimeti TaxID=1854472 RepID=A0AAE0HBF3_9PEZI|nr:nucleophile aminohydrolase [Chaetomium fimeti]